MAAENDAAYFDRSRPGDNDDPPAVTREIISIELDAERGPLVKASPSPRRPTQASPGAARGAARGATVQGGEDTAMPVGGNDEATPTAQRAQHTPIRAPIPRRQHSEPTYLEKVPPTLPVQQRQQQQAHFNAPDPDHEHQPRRPSASRSPAATTTTAGGGRESVNRSGGGEEGGGDGVGEDPDAETTLFMWRLWRNAELYGLTRHPSISRRPMLSGTIMAREPTVGFCSESSTSAIYGADGHKVVGNSTDTGGEYGNDGGGIDTPTPEMFPVCTFVLTTLGDSEQVLRNGIAQRVSGDGGDDDDETAAAEANQSFDVVLFVIEGARPMSCRSWKGEGSAITGVPGRDWWGNGPFPEDVAQQASQLVERLLRLAIAQTRRDTVWELFNLDNPWSLLKNAMVLPSKGQEHASRMTPTPPPFQAVQTQPPAWHPPLVRVTPAWHPPLARVLPDVAPQTPAVAASSRPPENPSLRAPSPAFSYTSIATGQSFSGVGDYHGLEGSLLPPVNELNLRDLLEVSVVTPLDVALPTLGGLTDPCHGVDWGGWFQHLVDSPAMRTLVFEDGDAVLAPAADPFDGTFYTASESTKEDEDDLNGNGSVPTLCPPTRRVLLTLPVLAAPSGDSTEDAGTAQSGGGSNGGVGDEEGSGAGPWVGSSHAGAPDLPLTSCPPQAASVLFCVILHKVGGSCSFDCGIICRILRFPNSIELPGKTFTCSYRTSSFFPELTVACSGYVLKLKEGQQENEIVGSLQQRSG